MPTQPTRVHPFLSPQAPRPLPILASHMCFGRSTAKVTLLAHEDLPPAHLAERMADLTVAPAVSFLSVATNTPSHRGLGDGDERVSLEALEVRSRAATPDDSWMSVSPPADEVPLANKVNKPRGEPGRPRSGGYNVQEAMGWSKLKYDRLQVSTFLWCTIRDH